MKAKDIRGMSPAEIQSKAREMREELLNLELRRHTGQVEKPSRFQELRRDIARCATVLREKNQAPVAK